MKAINELSNVDRAKLLFELFPQETALFIQFMHDYTKNIIEDVEVLKKKTVDQMHSTEFWQALVNNAKRRFDKYGAKLAKRSRLFSDQLFDGYDSLYASFCLQQYIRKEKCNRKFKDSVLLFFF